MDYEPITKEMREYVRDNTVENGNCWWQPENTKAVIAICNAIDAIHRSLEQENERLRDASERGDDWIKLPVDADGVPIRVGDEVVCHQINPAPRGIVHSIELTTDRWIVFVGNTGRPPHCYRHYKSDTWESIIEDAVKLGFTDPDNEHLADKLVARCKALCERTREGEE